MFIDTLISSSDSSLSSLSSLIDEVSSSDSSLSDYDSESLDVCDDREEQVDVLLREIDFELEL